MADTPSPRQRSASTFLEASPSCTHPLKFQRMRYNNKIIVVTGLTIFLQCMQRRVLTAAYFPRYRAYIRLDLQHKRHCPVCLLTMIAIVPVASVIISRIRRLIDLTSNRRPPSAETLIKSSTCCSPLSELNRACHRYSLEYGSRKQQYALARCHKQYIQTR